MNKLYYNGDILTMNDMNYEAIYVENGIIKEVGSFIELSKVVSKETAFIDLKGKCLMPGFIDSHSHVVQYANILNLVTLNEVTSIGEIIDKFKTYIKTKQPKENDFIMGFGYDHNFLAEKRHPVAKELDAIDYPILIAHASGHMGVANTKALQLLHLNDASIDPQGGKYGRDQNNHLNGYLEEAAFFNLTKNVASSTNQEDMILEALKVYASYGITTVQEGLMKTNEFNLLDALAKKQKLFLDVVGYVDIKEHRQLYQEHVNYHEYQNHFKLGGYKLFLDGSPQGKTAWLSKPYENSGDYCGYPNYHDEEVKEFIEYTKTHHVQLLTHCNGDQAATQLLNAFGHRPSSMRPVMIHCQTLRVDQLPALKQIGMIPSFFIAHVYYWGDVHQQNLGQRATTISCAKSALRQELPYTFHQDTPVIAPNMLETIWCAVKRETKSGIILGPEERLSVYNALKAITTNAAFQYFEEAQKGSIAPGKKADLVILSANPCKVEIDEIKTIRIIETIKDGNTVYQNRTI